MDTKIKRIIPLLLALGLFLGLIELLNTNFSLSHDAWAATPLEGDGLTITSISPSYGWNDQKTWVYIQGSGFVEPLTVTLNSISLTVSEVDSNRITAIIPSEMTPSLYDLTVQTTNNLSDIRYSAYRVLEPTDIDDLTSFSEWLWTEPRTLRIGYINSGIGLNVQRLGGRNTIIGSTVEFLLRNETGDVVLGGSQTVPLAPNTIESTAKVIWEPEEVGQYEICAIIDPDNEIEETTEDNNQICRTVTVLDQEPDVIAPIVQNFEIEDGVVSTNEVAVRLDVTAEDALPNPRSGLNAIKFIEYEYNSTSGWLPAQQSDWIAYSLAYQDYPWTLTTTYGMRYMQAWAVDKAGNISYEPAIDMINLLPSEQTSSLAEGEMGFYRILVNAGETLTATLTPVSGDPDLYVWGASGEPWVSSNPTGVDSVAFEAPETGTYQIEVHGYSDAEYRLTFGTTDMSIELSRHSQTGDKPLPTAPMVRLDDLPSSDFYDLNPPLNPVSNYYIYLPMVR